ncbi:MAG: DcrB-related protein [Myxococcota bacterium]
MPRHEDEHVRFDVPRRWEDRSVVAYAAPVEEGRVAPEVRVTRARLAPDEDLEAFVRRQERARAATEAGFTVHGRKRMEIDTRPAVTLAATRRDEGGARLAQRITMVHLPDRHVVTITMTAAHADLGQWAPLFARILQSFTFRPVAPP